jgi:hypothetical protein
MHGDVVFGHMSVSEDAAFDGDFFKRSRRNDLAVGYGEIQEISLRVVPVFHHDQKGIVACSPDGIGHMMAPGDKGTKRIITEPVDLMIEIGRKPGIIGRTEFGKHQINHLNMGLAFSMA